MLTRFLTSGSFALTLLLSSGFIPSAFAQHHGGHHGGGGGGGGSHHGGGSFGGGGSHHHHGGGGGGYGGGGYGGGGSSHHHHNHSGGGIYIGGGGFGIGYGSGYGGYGGYGGFGNGYNNYGGGYGGLRYSSGYRGDSNGGYYGNGGYSNSYPSYSSGVIVTPQYVNPAPNYVYQSQAPTVNYQSPSVQSSAVISPPQDSGQRSNLPGVSFGARAHLSELADAVAQRTNLLCVTLHDSYSGSPQFNEVYRDTYLLITMSQRLKQVSGDSQAALDNVAEMNDILTNVTPAIERWQPTGGRGDSAASHLSSVTSALKLLSVDAGWDGSQQTRRAAAPQPATEQTPPVAPLPEVAPAPELQSSPADPTPVDPVPVP